MAKLTNKQRLYLDFNATSPLAPPVREYLAKGDFLFGNPASLHATGKRSKRAINEVRDYLYNLFDRSTQEHSLFFHSGATEGINQLVKGMAYKLHANQEKLHFFCLSSDHSCVVSQADYLQAYGHHFSELPVTRDGAPDVEQILVLLAEAQGKILINLTLVNNESGSVLAPEVITQIKYQYPQALIHLDAVQGPGKVEHFSERMSGVDAFTLSCHKFGALKGIGFTFLSRNVPFHSVFEGGDQQESLRSGTENPDAVWSVKLALEWIMAQDVGRLSRVRDELETKILSEFSGQIEIAGANSKRRCANASYLIVAGVKADILLTAFDLAGIDVSTGSACRSGSVYPSRVLLAMGYSKEQARSAVRLSLGHLLSDDELSTLHEKVLNVLRRFKKD